MIDGKGGILPPFLTLQSIKKGRICNEKMAVPTGDVVKDTDVDREEYLFFLLKNETSEFTIGLGDILECLKFAEEQGEIPELPQEWWWKMSEVYPRLETYVDVPEDER